MYLKRIEPFLIAVFFISLLINIELFFLSSTVLFLFWLLTDHKKAIIPIIILIFMESNPIFNMIIDITLAKWAFLMLFLLVLLKIRTFEIEPIYIPLLGIALVFVLWYFNTLDTAILRWTITMIGNMALSVLLIFFIRQGKDNFRFLIYGILISLLLNSFLGFFQFFSNGHTLHYFGLNNEMQAFERWNGMIRVSGFFQNSNLFGAFLIPVSIGVLPVLKKNLKLLLFIPLLALPLTFSRSAIITLFIVMLFLGVFYDKKILPFFFLLLLLFFVSPFSQRFFTDDSLTSVFYSDLGRKKAMEAFNYFIANNFLIGIGPGRFYDHFSHFIVEEMPWRHFHPHNSFISLFAEGGIFSFLCLISFFIILLKYSLKTSVLKVKCFAISCIISLFILSNFNDLHWEPQFWIIPSLILGIIKQNE